MASQPGILAPCPAAAHYLTALATTTEQRLALYEVLAHLDIDAHIVVGLGPSLVQAGQAAIPGLRPFPPMGAGPTAVPATQADAWFYLRGNDPGETMLAACALLERLPSGIGVTEDVAGFKFGSGRDLTGYEDGTENPKGEAASDAAFVATGPFAGSSFVAAQRWVHDLAAFRARPTAEQDAIIGRRREDNEEMADAPPSAHVKRSAQESFDPAAFMLRRSMPYGTTAEKGLYFVAFGADLDRFERVMRRMVGQEDGIADALFGFSRAVSGGYYWCPPVRGGKLVLPAITPAAPTPAAR